MTGMLPADLVPVRTAAVPGSLQRLPLSRQTVSLTIG